MQHFFLIFFSSLASFDFFLLRLVNAAIIYHPNIYLTKSECYWSAEPDTPILGKLFFLKKSIGKGKEYFD